MKPLRTVTSPAVVLRDDNIDTDRIIPARFLTTTSSEGLGNVAFQDWRFDEAGDPRPEFAFNDPRAAGAQILVAGHNFGCGSSREHAAWALFDLGIRVVISTEIADIFRANAARNGILPIVIGGADHAKLQSKPFETMTVDLNACTITPADGPPISFSVDAFMRRCLLDGVDHLGFLLSHLDQIEAFDTARGNA